MSETIYTEETKEFYRAALTYWVAVLKHGVDSRIAQQEQAVLQAFEIDAMDRGATRAELFLLSTCAKVNVVCGHV